MALSENDIQTDLQIKRAVNEYFEKSSKAKVQAKELMNLFITEKVFKNNHKDGHPIPKFLNLLNDNGYLKLVPQAHFEPKAQNKNWFFIKIKI